MLEKLHMGLALVRQVKNEEIRKDTWIALPKTPDITFLLGHSFEGFGGIWVKYCFMRRPMPEMVLPSPVELIEKGEFPEIIDWPAEYHHQSKLWEACVIERLRQLGFSEGEVFAFFRGLANTPYEDLRIEVKNFLHEIPIQKKEQYHFLKNGTGDEGFVEGLLERTQLKNSRKELRGSTLPIIYLSDNEDRMLAEMALWGYRQGLEDNNLLETVQKYIKKIVGNSDHARDVLPYVLENYRTPDYPGSFNKYIRRCYPGFKDKKTFHPASGGFFTVEKAAEIIGCSTRTIYRWLGNIPGCRERYVKVTNQKTFIKNEYKISAGDLEQLKELKKFKVLKKWLIKEYAKKRGVGTTAAQRWVKRQVDAGKNLVELAREFR